MPIGIDYHIGGMSGQLFAAFPPVERIVGVQQRGRINIFSSARGEFLRLPRKDDIGIEPGKIEGLYVGSGLQRLIKVVAEFRNTSSKGRKYTYE